MNSALSPTLTYLLGVPYPDFLMYLLVRVFLGCR